RQVGVLPLRGVANRSLAERWRKWRRRRPYALWVIAVASAVLLALAAVGVHFYHEQRAWAEDRLRQAEAALAEGQKFLAEKNPGRAAEQFERGLALARQSSAGEGLAGRLEA